jgi:hypothetical protein
MVSSNNIIIKYPSTGTVTKQVTIGTTRVEENWTKTLTLVTPPKSTANQNITEGANTSLIIDLLLKAEKRWTIDGEIITNLGSGDTNSDAADKRDDLKAIFFAGGTFLMNVEGTDYIVNSDKFSVDWKVDDKTIIDEYTIKFTVVEGQSIG